MATTARAGLLRLALEIHALRGWVTDELMEEFWPTADQDPSRPPPIVEFAQIWRDMLKLLERQHCGCGI